MMKLRTKKSDKNPQNDKKSKNSIASQNDFHRKLVNKEIKQAETKSKSDRFTQLKIQAALEQDSKIFEYDSVYGEVSNFQKAKDEEERRKKLNLSIKKPKYIKGMLKTAAKRQLEDERRYERRAIKERKNEDHLFDDKEKFITPAYKEKMEKLEKAEEEIQRRDELDRLQDVKKQTGLSGFYRHLLNDKEKDQQERDAEREEQIQKELKLKQEKEEEELKKETEVKQEASETAETLETTETSENPESSKTRYDSDSSDSDSGSDVSSTGGMSSGGSIDEDRFGEGEMDPETKAFHEKFGMKLSKKPSHPAAPSTTMTKMSMRSRVTAGGAGVETEIDWEMQLEKLQKIFELRNSEDDINVARRRYFQRQAIRDGKGGWAKILREKN